MATTALRNGKRITLSIVQKARMLPVFDDHPELKANELAVTSGTAFGCAYVVTHDSKVSTHCTCDARTPECAHRVSANWFLEARNRAAFDAVFNPNNVA